MRGIVIAGTHSGCGKTTVTLGILAALKKKGMSAQPFKTGPDFIDAGLHRLVAERPSRNLDVWMCGPEYVADCFKRHSSGADISVIEGVMGMHDGDYSTASLARLLDVPVVLVIDAYGMAESAGAVARGFADFAYNAAGGNELKFAGVIFNRVASANHFSRLRDSVRNMPVLGYLPRELNFEIPHRHLGLTTAVEQPIAAENLDTLAEAILAHVDIDRFLLNARIMCNQTPVVQKAMQGHGRFKLAVAYDKAFSFYYEDNLDMLRDAGGEIIRFSPLSDPAIPDSAEGVYIGGGYPELHASALSDNVSMRKSIKEWANAGKPLYAECGGLMYLSQGIRDFDNALFPMAGVFPFETRMMKKPRLGYREFELNENCILGRRGERYRGHEFHYSEISGEAGGTVYAMTDNKGKPIQSEGFLVNNTLASYVHVHFGSNPRLARHIAEMIGGETKA